MMLNSKYIDQVSLLIDLIPLIATDERLAIKGGTALNLFILDFPRLSVDIDLCYLPLKQRDEALLDIASFNQSLAAKCKAMGFKTREKKTSDGYESTLFVQHRTTEVKVETNLVVRGAVYQPQKRSLVPQVQERFKRNATMQCLDVYDLYAGKLCAALDRQNPRDFFDLFVYFNDHAYSRQLHEAFIVYLLSSKRPLSELIDPNKQDIIGPYQRLFAGMTAQEVSCDLLEKTRDQVFTLTKEQMTPTDKEFLLSFKSGAPQWNLFPIPTIADFPAIKWKLFNIQSMSPSKRKEALKRLEQKLS